MFHVDIARHQQATECISCFLCQVEVAVIIVTSYVSTAIDSCAFVVSPTGPDHP